MIVFPKKWFFAKNQLKVCAGCATVYISASLVRLRGLDSDRIALIHPGKSQT